MARPGYAVVDTLALARRKRPELVSHRLESRAGFRLDPAGSTTALADSVRVKELWLRLGGPDEPAERLVAFPFHDETRRCMLPSVGTRWPMQLCAGVAFACATMAAHGGTRRGEVTRRDRSTGRRLISPRDCHLDSFEKSFRLDRDHAPYRSSPTSESAFAVEADLSESELLDGRVCWSACDRPTKRRHPRDRGRCRRD